MLKVVRLILVVLVTIGSVEIGLAEQWEKSALQATPVKQLITDGEMVYAISRSMGKFMVLMSGEWHEVTALAKQRVNAVAVGDKHVYVGSYKRGVFSGRRGIMPNGSGQANDVAAQEWRNLGLKGKKITALGFYQSQLYAGTADGDVYGYKEGGNGQWHKYGQVNFGKHSKHNAVTTILVHKNILYVGTREQGLLKLALNADGLAAWSRAQQMFAGRGVVTAYSCAENGEAGPLEQQDRNYNYSGKNIGKCAGWLYVSLDDGSLQRTEDGQKWQQCDLKFTQPQLSGELAKFSTLAKRISWPVVALTAWHGQLYGVMADGTLLMGNNSDGNGVMENKLPRCSAGRVHSLAAVGGKLYLAHDHGIHYYALPGYTEDLLESYFKTYLPGKSLLRELWSAGDQIAGQPLVVSGSLEEEGSRIAELGKGNYLIEFIAKELPSVQLVRVLLLASDGSIVKQLDTLSYAASWEGRESYYVKAELEGAAVSLRPAVRYLVKERTAAETEELGRTLADGLLPGLQQVTVADYSLTEQAQLETGAANQLAEVKVLSDEDYSAEVTPLPGEGQAQKLLIKLRTKSCLETSAAIRVIALQVKYREAGEGKVEREETIYIPIQCKNHQLPLLQAGNNFVKNNVKLVGGGVVMVVAGTYKAITGVSLKLYSPVRAFNGVILLGTSAVAGGHWIYRRYVHSLWRRIIPNSGVRYDGL